MEEVIKIVNIGIFWAVPNEIDGGWSFYVIRMPIMTSSKTTLDFLDYPFSHYTKWDDVRSADDTSDCYYYPRGRVLYDTKTGKHRIFADECLDEISLQEIIEKFKIQEYTLCRDEHYVSAFTKKRNTAIDEPVLTYNILRGQDKIGENLIEIRYGKTKILVELGKALDGDGELSELERRVLNNSYNAVIVSHYHEDHAGLIRYKHDCPIYIGSGAYRVVKAMSEYHDEALASNVTTYRNGKAFCIGGIKITPFLCDHSAFDSHMLLFQAGGKSILYTGDFRFHGRLDKSRLLSALPKSVEVLIHEGTNLGNAKPCFSERELEDELVKIIRKNDKPVFVLQSASNIDRLVSVYRAAKRSGRVLYEDNYTALIASAAGGKIPRPDVVPDVYAFTPRLLRGKRKDMFFEIENKRGLKGIVNGKKFVMIVRPSMGNYIKKLFEVAELKEATLIYSMWEGYKESDYMTEFLTEMQMLGVKIIDLHTSGHAAEQDIDLLKQTVNAMETVCVHTGHSLVKNC